jgi:phosphatidylserine decarboxylase
MVLLIFIIIFLLSTLLYYYLHKKTRMNLKFMYIDNFIVATLAFLISYLCYSYIISDIGDLMWFIISLVIGGFFIVSIGYALTMYRFWRSPNRKVTASENEIVSPADGNVLYIKRIEAGETPISIKNGHLNKLEELTKTSLLENPCWLIGINMTPWDVHKNCSPIDGIITLNKYARGKFLSLKLFESLTENERNTYVIENNKLKVGIVQIASKGVRRINSYVQQGSTVKRGDWLGMIRFGSQVDVILPYNCNVKIKAGQQIYAIKTVIASS